MFVLISRPQDISWHPGSGTGVMPGKGMGFR